MQESRFDEAPDDADWMRQESQFDEAPDYVRNHGWMKRLVITSGWSRNHELMKCLQEMFVWKVGLMDDKMDELFKDKIIGGSMEMFEDVLDEDLVFPLAKSLS